jgi:hypothetical protein
MPLTRAHLILAVDAAMVEMQNISPPLRRSECERLIRAALSIKAAPEPVQGEAVGRFCGEFGGDVNGNMWFKVKTRGSIPAPGAMLYTAEAKPDDELAAMRARGDQIEREIMANKHTAASVFTQMRTAALYTAPPSPDAELAELRALLAGTNYAASADCHNARVVAAAIARIDTALARLSELHK